MTRLVTPRIVQGQDTGKRIGGDAVFAANCRKLAAAFVRARPHPRRQPLADLFAAIEERSSILEQLRWDRDKILVVLLRLFDLRDRWHRSPLDWQPTSDDPREQSWELVRHLFERYPTPAFFRAVWPRRRLRVPDWTGFGWYLHVAGGANLRTAPELPLVLSSRAAHETLHAPAATPLEAMRWGQLRALRLRDHHIHAVLQSRAGARFELDPWLVPLFHKIAADPAAVPAHQVGPLVDYVIHHHNRPLGKRPIAAIVRAMETWHRDLGRRDRVFVQLGAAGAAERAALWSATWPALAGAVPRTDLCDDGAWTVEELCSFQSLFEEGQRMRHCVASYARSCLGGHTAIWSLHKRDPLGHEADRITFRVTVGQRQIVEARAYANRAISREGFAVLQAWARRHGLRLASIPVS